MYSQDPTIQRKFAEMAILLKDEGNELIKRVRSCEIETLDSSTSDAGYEVFLAKNDRYLEDCQGYGCNLLFISPPLHISILGSTCRGTYKGSLVSLHSEAS